MQRVLIIGHGNPYRGDDGLGFRAAEQYEASNRRHATVEVMAVQRLKPEHVQNVAQSDLVIFLAVGTKGEPGTVCGQEVFPESRCDGLFTRELTPCALLGASSVIYKRCPQAYLISVTGDNFGFSSQLSSKVEAALPEVMQRIDDVLKTVQETPADAPKTMAAFVGQ